MSSLSLCVKLWPPIYLSPLPLSAFTARRKHAIDAHDKTEAEEAYNYPRDRGLLDVGRIKIVWLGNGDHDSRAHVQMTTHLSSRTSN